MRDHYKTEIKPGVRVAFNYQGFVRIGIVTEVKINTARDGERGWLGPRVKIHIKHQDDPNQISIVKNEMNLAVI